MQICQFFREMAPRIEQGHERGCAGRGEGTRGKKDEKERTEKGEILDIVGKS